MIQRLNIYTVASNISSDTLHSVTSSKSIKLDYFIFIMLLGLFMNFSIVAQQSLILDLGGVLLREPERNLEAILPFKNSVDIRIFNCMFEFAARVTGKDCKQEWLLGTMSGAEVLTIIGNNIDSLEHVLFFKSEQERLLIKYGAEHILLPENIAKLTYLDAEGFAFIKLCKANNIRLLILSNWDPQSFIYIQEKFSELFSLIDEKDIFIPTITGYTKPDIHCFSFIVQTTGIEVETTFFVDDSFINVNAGKLVGFNVVYHKDWKTTVIDLKQRGLRLDNV